MSNNQIDFIGIGAAKSGSSWLAECLRQHPNINLPGNNKELNELNLHKNKELNYFTKNFHLFNTRENLRCTNYDRGIDWYLNQFPKTKYGIIKGEISPSYLFDSASSCLIKKQFPNIKIIVILRNPIDLIYSLFWFKKYTIDSKFDHNFEEAINEGSILKHGLLYQQLQKYYQQFPEKNIHSIIYDQIKLNPQKEIQKLYQFLNVNSNFKPANINKKINKTKTVKSENLKKICQNILIVIKNIGLSSLAKKLSTNYSCNLIYHKINLSNKNYPPMAENTRKKLKKYYQEEINNLQNLINHDLSNWE